MVSVKVGLSKSVSTYSLKMEVPIETHFLMKSKSIRKFDGDRCKVSQEGCSSRPSLARRAIPLCRTRICSLIGAVTIFDSMLIGLETEFSRSASALRPSSTQ